MDLLHQQTITIRGQVVISGERKAVEFGAKILLEEGAKRAVILNTNGPFHTNKLEQAKVELEKELEKISIKKGKMPVIKNIDGLPYIEEDNVKEILAKHMISPVRFDKTIEYMQSKEIQNFIEVGPGKTLTGFVKKVIKEANVIDINNILEGEKL